MWKADSIFDAAWCQLLPFLEPTRERGVRRLRLDGATEEELIEYFKFDIEEKQGT